MIEIVDVSFEFVKYLQYCLTLLRYEIHVRPLLRTGSQQQNSNSVISGPRLYVMSRYTEYSSLATMVSCDFKVKNIGKWQGKRVEP